MRGRVRAWGRWLRARRRALQQVRALTRDELQLAATTSQGPAMRAAIARQGRPWLGLPGLYRVSDPEALWLALARQRELTAREAQQAVREGIRAVRSRGAVWVAPWPARARTAPSWSAC